MLTVDNLSKSFGKKTVLDNISVQLTHGVYGWPKWFRENNLYAVRCRNLPL